MGDDRENKHKPPLVSRFKRVCVFCGSSAGKRNCYREAAVELAGELIGSCLWRRKYWLNGTCLSRSSQWRWTCDWITGETVGEVRPVADMHQRKAEMARHSDCFIALPGGYGTLEELLEVITWAQLGIHDKPVGLLNVHGYYNSLLSFIDKAVDDGFIMPSQRSIIVSAPNAKELVQKLEEYVPVHDGVLAKANWEAEQMELNATLQTEFYR
ncbi:cytokinin riboside 5'-monophosphate phosphoribohydrolase LOG1-like isoform X3 [Benincasa hispida]|uniref:cytokinin riboside 5'-monophosphate phosphoribohydrolase LOG1-like isoform X3 n=1 Tax=Benincasa hispida TaxID=102211 RepID=UPI0018FF1FD7|nr:cytokinin riboside 5'-monophosphate phosphoribohydrolase LOG1-like isoform X3 [Benincasa hispida]